MDRDQGSGVRGQGELRPGVCHRQLEGGFITVADYDEAIAALKAAKTQLSPDGDCCHICGDGHQAWECRHNPLVMARRAALEDFGFRCFHCGQLFFDGSGEFESAEEHFGNRDDQRSAKCLSSRKENQEESPFPDPGVDGAIPGFDIPPSQIITQFPEPERC